MVITFPHMGRMYIPVKALFDELGVDIVIPPKISKKTLEMDLNLSREWLVYLKSNYRQLCGKHKEGSRYHSFIRQLWSL